MRPLTALVMSLFLGVLWAQDPVPEPPAEPPKEVVYVCPMDPDIRSHNPATCSRCGMKMVSGIPDPVEFHLNLTAIPRAPQPGQPARLKFEVHDPWKNNPVTNFQLIHEKFFHAFVISQDLEFFLHDHPTLGLDGAFHYNIAFPKAGVYRVFGDFF